MKYVSYIRVSTDQQGASGLGLAAQNEAVERYVAAQEGGELVAVFREVQSGAKRRPGLNAAVAEAKHQGAVVIVAKLDRIGRDCRMILELMDSGVELVFLDLQVDTTTPVGRAMVTKLGAIAELERGLISERTKVALAQMPDDRHPGRLSEARALAGYQEAKPAVLEFLADNPGATYQAVADRLNDLRIPAPAGGRWHPPTTGRLLAAVVS